LHGFKKLLKQGKIKMFHWLNTKTIFLIMLLGPLGCVNVGCGTSSSGVSKEVPEVSGMVLLPTGRPLKGGQLMLRPFGDVKGALRLSADVNEDGTFIINPSDSQTRIIVSKYKVFVGLNDPKYRSLRRLVPEKYLDVREDEFETDLFMNLNEQTSGIVLKMTK
jgi:hypothetical protein